jgi:hypothetical protein
MRKLYCIAFLMTIVVALGINSHTQTTGTPGWLRFLGDGSEGAYSCPQGSSSTCVLGDEHWYSSFTVAAGATLATTGQNGPIIIRSTGMCTVAGTMSDSPNSGAGVTITGGGDFGGSGGGGGGGSGAGQNGLSSFADANLIINNGGSGGAAGTAGTNGASPVAEQYHSLLGGGTFWPVGGAAGGVGGSSGGVGGWGGGPIILVCNTIDFTGTIDVSGGPGAPSTSNNSGAGGGGGGGYVILSAVTYTANTGTINTSGGAGGSCGSNSGCGVGGKGGDGWSVALTIQ